MQNQNFNVHLRLILTMTFWGGTFIAAKIAGAQVHPISAATGRFVFASLILLGFMLLTEKKLPRITLHQWGGMCLLGLTGVFSYNIFFFTGLQHIDAGRGAMIIAINPVATTLLAVFFFKERFGPVRCLGIALSVAGALAVISHGHISLLFKGEIGFGELCILGAVSSWAAYTLLGRKLLMAANISPLTAVTYSCVTGSVMLIALMLAQGRGTELLSMNMKGLSATLYLALFGTAIGFIWFYQGVQTLGAGRAVLFVNLVPVNGVLLGVIILGEQVDSSLLIGGGLVLSGLLLINRKPRSKALHKD